MGISPTGIKTNVGGSEVGGPLVGAYIEIPLTLIGVNPAATAPGAVTLTLRHKLAQAIRVDEVSFTTAASSGGASRPTVQITDGTNNLFSASTLNVAAAGAVSVTPTSAVSLVAAQRTRAKGDILQIQVTFVAAEITSGLTCSINGHSLAHAVATAAAPDFAKNF